MKVLVPVHSFNNFGGIINHNEQLIAGLKEMGHDVTFAFLKPTAVYPKKVEIPTVLAEGYAIGEGTGLPVHQGKGWITDYYSFLNKKSIQEFVEMANQHDVVIWQSIFGFKNKNTEENVDWLPMVQDVTAKQVAIIHDGNLRKLYPWINLLKHKLAGLACVHPSAYASAEAIDLPRAMILNPQQIDPLPKAPAFSERKRQLLSAQTFKRWKRVDDLVASVPYLKDAKVYVAGDGIERNYMCSIDKCKPEYYCTKERDPHASDDILGNKIWDNATANGMEYLGFITEKRRDGILRESLFMIDSSWSNSYGEHFNRVVVDAMRTGTVPIAVNRGIASNDEGIGSLFRPNKNYLMLKFDYKPKEYADKINQFLDIPEKAYMQIVENNYKVIQNFDRKKIAEDYINLAFGKDAGYHGKLETPKFTDPKFERDGNKQWDAHFVKEEVASLDSFFG
jgi:glycosyltransferase involved in cell wall biosynthesis